MKKYNYVYKITNNINSKIYIGKHSTDDINDGYMGSGVVLHQAYKKYGLENFKKEVIDYYTSDVELNRAEIYWIARFNSTDPEIGYNLTYGGDGGILTEEVRKKLSAVKKGKPLSEEHRRKLSEAHKGKQLWLGKKHSEETRRKLSEAHKGCIFSEEHRRKIGEARKGKKLKPMSEETKRKISESLKGNTGFWTGRHRTDETKRKISESLKKKKIVNK